MSHRMRARTSLKTIKESVCEKQHILAVASIVVLISFVSVPLYGSAVTYNFSATLANPVNGNAQVNGHFTLDANSATISAFEFTTPVEQISSTGLTPTWSANVFTISGTNPSATFVNLVFLPGGGFNPPDAFELIFQTSLSSFDINTFYTGVVTYAQGQAQSNLTCINGCNGYGSTFVPEPSSLILTGAGAAWLFGITRRKKLFLLGSKLPVSARN